MALALQANAQVNPIYLRQVVNYPTSERSGTIVVDTRDHFLYSCSRRPRLRYGIGVDGPGFRMVRNAPGEPQGGMAGLDPAGGDAQAPAGPAGAYGRRA